MTSPLTSSGGGFPLWGIFLCMIGGSSTVAVLAYYLLCRRMQKRSYSEDFNAKVPTAPDTPYMEETRARGDTETSNADYRQAIMHDDEEARDLLIRSSVLFSSVEGGPPRPGGEQGVGISGADRGGYLPPFPVPQS
uniref:Uncharacterized protein n=1 Tax=Rhizochromulina marina TaxID=1034831 RepID=A0A7S2SUL6_9STRA|mmetsp:Transcript_8554/g.24368  ORF Transcript_8554/g.24368 Transcript_8554/m.24368 type:complete len:136 (+) Transcript_8554:141-548(+)